MLMVKKYIPPVTAFDAERLVVANEAIMVQSDRVFVEDIIARVHVLKDEFEADTLAFGNGISFFKNAITKNVIKEIDKLIFKRFGFKTQHIHGNGIGYAITPIQPKSMNVLFGDVDKKYDELKHHATRDSYDKSKIRNMHTDLGKIYKELENSHDSLQKQMNVKGVTIDLKNARIENLPEDFSMFMIADFSQLFRMGLSSRHIAAIILHEIGHGFTHISESYRSIKLTSTMYDMMKETDGMPQSARYTILNEKMFGGAAQFDDEDTDEVRMIKLQTVHAKALMGDVGKDTLSATDSEMMADAFASRFGMGKELAESLLHFNFSFNRGIGKAYWEVATFSFWVGLLLTFNVGVALAAALAVSLGIYIGIKIGQAIAYSIVGGSKSRETTYDSSRERINRLLRQEISVLQRTGPSNKEAVAQLRENISALKELVYEMEDISFTEVIGDHMPWNYLNMKDTELQQDLERGMYNTLHDRKYDWGN